MTAKRKVDAPRIMSQPVQDMSLFHKIKRGGLLNVKYSDGIEFEAKGALHDVIPDEYKRHIEFWASDVYAGVEVVTYKGRVAYFKGHNLRSNQTDAVRILEGIKNGYDYGKYKDYFED